MGLLSVKGAPRPLREVGAGIHIPASPVIRAPVRTPPPPEPRGEPQADRDAVKVTQSHKDVEREHLCHCGAWGAFGVGVKLRAGQLGRWYCHAHKPGGAA